MFMLIAVSLLSTVTSAAVLAEDVSEIAKVCMDAESSLQDFIMIGMEATYANPKQHLEVKLAEIEEFVSDVGNHDMSTELHAEVVEIQKLWHQIKPELSKQPTIENSVALRELIDDFVNRCEELDEHLADATTKNSTHVIVLVADLGVEVQRMAVGYLLKAWGYQDPAYDEKVKSELTKFTGLYEEILPLAKANNMIVDKLNAIKKNFLVFKFMAASKSGRFVPAVAQKNATAILKMVLEIIEIEEKI